MVSQDEFWVFVSFMNDWMNICDGEKAMKKQAMWLS